MMKILSAILVICVTTATWAQEIDGEIELAGFLLGQYRTAVHTQLGPPIQRSVSEDGWIFEFHALKPDTSVYVLFKYTQADTTRIYAIQLNGDRYEEMIAFRGLKLGATKTEVQHVLGMPDKTETIADPPIDLQYYPNKNYSVDITRQGRLFGIQVFGNILDKKPASAPSSKSFRNAVMSRNVDSLLVHLAPDVEFHKHGKVIRYSGSAREEFRKKDSELIRCLLGEKESVRYAFTTERAEGTPELKPVLEGNRLISVDKFFDSSVISEIVFKPHAGKWKVAQVNFR
jgi:hypothetical protein